MSQRAMNRLNNIAGNPFAASQSQVSSVPCSGGGSKFSNVQLAPPNAIFLTKALFKKDTSPNKMNLGIGAYRDDDGKPYPLQCVKKAEAILLADYKQTKEYLPITGDAEYSRLAAGLVFSKEDLDSGRIASVQTISGTGSLRVGIEFAKKVRPNAPVLLSNPSWGNHPTIIKASGMQSAKYRYWDPKNRRLDIDGMLEDLRNAPNGCTVMLHACAHNPTGVDPTREQWKAIQKVTSSKNMLVLFDSAYQGFASDLDNDAWAMRYFVSQGDEIIMCQSFAKNFGLYCERAGNVHVVCKTAALAKACKSQIALIIRPMYSNPPAHGARIVKTVLGNPDLYAMWVKELKGMSDRIIAMRTLLRGHLEKMNTPGTWAHITTQIGMFTFTGLTPKQCEAMISKWHVYLLKNGRISMAGINTGNVEYLARAINDVTRNA